MDELVKRLVAETGIDQDAAVKAVGIIFAFLMSEGPAEQVKAVLDRVPGAQDALAGAGSGGAMGGVMGAGMQLMGLGLGMDQVQQVTRVVMAYAREKVGEDKVGEIVAAIPGLSQFA